MSTTVLAPHRTDRESSIDLPATPIAPRLARRHLTTLVEDWHLADKAADAQVVLSELVGNAVRHAGAFGLVRLQLRTHQASALYLAVLDGSSQLPVLRAPDLASLGGRGLHLVQQLTARWGVDLLQAGKRVWAELH
jgi:anti-sigma regulatory factor (Ser/Thr protein kinase)